MEVLESFDCYVDSVDGDTAYVTLESLYNGDVLYGEYPANRLLSIGIGEHDRFLLETVKDGKINDVDLVGVRISKAQKNEITEDEAKAISMEIQDYFELCSD